MRETSRPSWICFFLLVTTLVNLTEGGRKKNGKVIKVSLAFPAQLENDLGTPVLRRRFRLTSRQQQDLLAAHNTLRAREPAANMQEMVWDPKLARLAGQWARKCLALHRTGMDRSRRFSYDFVGENIWWSNEDGKELRDLGAVTRDFFSEKKYYDFNLRRCQRGQICGHYTQVVWANSCAVGCAAVHCDRIKYGLGISRGHVIVCNYGPGGNKLGERPYVKGEPCSSCPGQCSSQGLCPSQCLGPGKIEWNKQFAPLLSKPSTPSKNTPTIIADLSSSLIQPFSLASASRITGPVNKSCVDINVNCRFWAAIGECSSNPEYMLQFCGTSCNRC